MSAGSIVDALLARRAAARAAQDFVLSDVIRAGLIELGIVVNDTPLGTEWHVKGK